MALIANIATWSSTDYKSVTAAQIASLTLEQVKLMVHPDWLLPAAVAGFTAAQIPLINTSWVYMNAAWLNALSPSALAAVPTTGVVQFSSTAIAGLDVAHTQALTVVQLDALSVGKLSTMSMAALTTAQLTGMAAAKWSSFTAAQLNAIPASKFTLVPAASVAKFGSTPIAGLDVAHTQALTVVQLDALSVGKLSTMSMAALTTAQLTGMAAAKWSSFTAAQLNAIPASKFALVPAASVAKFGSTACAGLDVMHVQALGTTQMAALYYPEKLSLAAVAALSPTQVAAISTSFYWMGAAWLNALTPAAFAAITAKGIGQLAGTTTAGLDVAHTRALTATQLNAISLGARSLASVAALLPSQVAAITQTFYWRTPEWLNALSTAAFAAIPPAGITQMKSATIAALDATHVGAMTASQVAALDYWQRTSLTTAQMGWISASAIAGFTTAQLDDLTTAQIAGLTAVQTAGLTTTQIASLTPKQLAALSASAASGFSATQVAAMGTNVCVLAPAAIATLPVTTFSQLTLMQLSSLQGDQVAALTSTQLASLSATQANYLTAGQLDVLGSKVQSLSVGAVAGLSNTNLLIVYPSLSATQLAALSPAQTAMVQATGSTVATLLTSLTDAGVRAQVTAVLDAGESLFSYNGLVKVLGGVGASIGATGLTTTQMNDLKVLSTAVGQTLGSSSYLARITSNVVNGDMSNAWWTGGAASQTPLGNLAVGSAADQMGKLVGKWFLGTDLPTWTGTASYTSFDAPLFAAGGPQAWEVSQGGIGDCYLLAAMVTVADDYASMLETMFTDNGNGTWGVRFYAPNDDPLYVTVSNVLPEWSTGTATSGALWVSLLEKAYVEWEVHYKGEMNNYDGISGGDSRSFQALMGRSSTYYSVSRYTVDAWITSVKDTVITALNSGQAVMYGSSVTTADPLGGKTELVGGHMFAVRGFDAVTNEFILQNPWGSEGGSGWLGVFGMEAAELWVGSNNFVITNEASPVGALDTVYNYNAHNEDNAHNAASQLVQAMATQNGAAASTGGLTSQTALDPTRLLLLSAA